jgi:hypothetical protein
MTHFFLLQSEIPKVIASSSPDFAAGKLAASADLIDPMRVGTYGSLVAFLTVVLGQLLKSPLLGEAMRRVPQKWRFLVTTGLSSVLTGATAWLTGMSFPEAASTGVLGLVTAIVGYNKGADMLNYSTGTVTRKTTPPPAVKPEPTVVKPVVEPSVVVADQPGDQPVNVPPPSEPPSGA